MDLLLNEALLSAWISGVCILLAALVITGNTD